MSDRPDIVLLRSKDEGSDPYVSAFKQEGRKAVCEPVLGFAFPNQHTLRDRFERRDHYTGLIATSPRAATAIDCLFADHGRLARVWRGATAYTVGPKTAERLGGLGFEPRGADAGNAKRLARRIIDDDSSRPLLFLSGNRRRDVLPRRLTAANVAFEEVVVYETRPRENLALPSSAGSTWLVFFSPSGLEAVAHSASLDLGEYRLAAIGPTTGEALREAGQMVAAVAPKPSPEGLVSAIQAAETEA